MAKFIEGERQYTNMTYDLIPSAISRLELDDTPHWTLRVTPELLSDIFTWCIEANEKAPFNVSQVCRRWRCIALSTPQLWRKLPFREWFSDVTEERRFITFLSEDYLLRSGGVPITFSWHPWHQLAQDLLQVLLQHVERWGDVNLVAHEKLLIHMSNLQDHLLSLYALKVTVANDSGSVSLQPFQSAPKLRCFSLIDRRIDAGVPVLFKGSPWNQVTHISISLDTTHNFDYHSLSLFSNLTYLHFHWPRWTLIPEGIAREHLRKPLTFKSCRYLQLDFSHPRGVTHNAPFPNPLQNMYFPNLEYLFIEYDPMSFTDPFTLTELESFIGRLKACKVTPLKSFHWFRHCNYYATPTPAPPNAATTQSRTVFRLLPQTLSNLRVTLFPRFLLEKLFNVLTTEGSFLPGLKKLDLGVDVSALSSRGEFDWFCDNLKSMMATTKRRLHEIRIQLIPVPPARPWNNFPPWQFILRLDGWEDILRDDVERNMGCSIGREDDEFMNGTDAESIWVKNLRRTLLEFMRSDNVLSQHTRLRTNPLFRLETINRWLKIFKTNANSRQWTSLGHDGIMYVSPRSSLRESESWVFGVADDPSDVEDIRYIDNDRVPGVPRSWLDVRDLTMYYSPTLTA